MINFPHPEWEPQNPDSTAFTRRGEKWRCLPGVDLVRAEAKAEVEEGDACAAPSSLPTAGCLLPCSPHRVGRPHVQLRSPAATRRERVV